MTTREMLDAHFQLLREREAVAEMLNSLEKTGPRVQHITGMPHTPGYSDPTSALAIEIADMRNELTRLDAEIARSEKEVSAFIEGIDDVICRQLLRLRFLRGLTWKEVAGAAGRRYTEGAAKNSIYRFLKARGESICQHEKNTH